MVSASSVKATTMEAPVIKAASVKEPSMKVPAVKAAAKYTNESAIVEAVRIAVAVKVRIGIVIGIDIAVPVGRLGVTGRCRPHRVTPRRHTLDKLQLIGDGLIGRFRGGRAGSRGGSI